MNIESQFWNLVETANLLDAEERRILNDDNAQPIDTNRMVEAIYLAICRLVTAHPAERGVFVGCFTELVLQNRKSPWMLVPFCMRVLRFLEIKEVLHREMDRRKYGTAAYATMMNYCSSVMHAYDDKVWENAIGFETFAPQMPDGGCEPM